MSRRLGGRHIAALRGAFLPSSDPRETMAHAMMMKLSQKRPEIGRSTEDDPQRAAFFDSLKAKRIERQFLEL